MSPELLQSVNILSIFGYLWIVQNTTYTHKTTKAYSEILIIMLSFFY